MSPRARAALAYLAMFAGFGALVPYSTLYYQARGLDFGEIGWLLSLGALIGLLAGPGWGSVSDRRSGSPRVLVTSASVAIGGIALLALASDFSTIVAANVVLGVGLAGLSPIIDARALETAGADRAGYGPLRAWGSIGYVASSFLMGLVVQAVGVESIFWVMGVSMALTAVIGLNLRPAVVTRAANPLRSTLRVFRGRTLALFLVGAFLAWSAMSAILDFFALRFDEMGAGAGMIGTAAALAAALEVPVMLGFPVLARRFRGEQLLVAGAAILAVRAVLAAAATDPLFLVVASGIGGVGYALFLVGGVTYVSEHVPKELAATGQGIFQGVANSLSQVVAAAGAGLVAGAFGIAGMFAVAAVVAVVAALVTAVAVRPAVRGQPTPAPS